LELFMRLSEKVLWELMVDMRLAGSQHFEFYEYKNQRGNKLFAGHSNGSVSFQSAQIQVGEGKVPVSIVLYIDGTCLKKGILNRPVHRKCIYIIPYITYDVMSDIVSDITFRLIGQSVVSTMTDR
jgi:predicted amidohydrolase